MIFIIVCVSNSMIQLESFLNHFVAVSNKDPFDPTPCLGHYEAYEKAVNTHMDKLMSEVSYVVYSETTMKIGQLLHMANEEISKIRNLRVQATTCNGLECNDVSNKQKSPLELFSKAFRQPGRKRNISINLPQNLNVLPTSRDIEKSVAYFHWLVSILG